MSRKTAVTWKSTQPCNSGFLLQHGADRAVTGRAKRRDRATESRKPNGMGAADERLQGAGRGDCESGIDL